MRFDTAIRKIERVDPFEVVVAMIQIVGLRTQKAISTLSGRRWLSAGAHQAAEVPQFAASLLLLGLTFHFEYEGNTFLGNN